MKARERISRSMVQVMPRVLAMVLPLACALLPAASVPAGPIPEEVKQTTTFIFVKGPDGQLAANGTGVFVGVRDERKKSRLHGYLVTAKHVLHRSAQTYFPEIFIKLNKRDGGTQTVRIPLSGDQAVPVHVHADPTVELAVLPFLPNSKDYEVRLLLEDFVAGRDAFRQAKIQEGDEVFVSSLFSPLVDSGWNLPVLRFGRIALLPGRKLPIQGTGVELILVELLSSAGSSGSPVFLYRPAVEGRAPTLEHPGELLLTGILRGGFFKADELRVSKEEDQGIRVSVQNLGMSGVVPAPYLRDILFSDSVKRARGEAP